jgi:hypothetical protein
MGGRSSACLKDVWKSSNGGASWNLVTNNAGWVARMYHSSVALSDNSILLFGGGDKDPDGWNGIIYNDMWKSVDKGSSWTLVAENTPWAGRWFHY